VNVPNAEEKRVGFSQFSVLQLFFWPSLGVCVCRMCILVRNAWVFSEFFVLFSNFIGLERWAANVCGVPLFGPLIRNFSTL